MAEGALRAALAEAGIAAHVDSCGTADYHIGKSPDPRAVAAMAERGIDISGLAARQLVPEDFARFDRIYAMDAANLRAIEELQPPGSQTPATLLLDAVPGREGASLVDPYYGGEEDFVATWDDVCMAAAAIARELAD
ncbi:low molecular weight protein-tyrosine-phosphatase [Qipengyuania sp. MTN3-11]|uniref:low molecular weight protein-tyrosine-phosphatase n=1 Tax=Qipengyuania sp. MTN3-11 TaxID=3056557 RepID=UPI0036F1A627